MALERATPLEPTRPAGRQAGADVGDAGAGQLALGERPTFRERLAGGAFPTVVELVPWAGPITDEAGRIPLETARALAADRRVAAGSSRSARS